MLRARRSSACDQGDVQFEFGAAGLHRPIMLQAMVVEPWFGHGVVALHAGEQTEKPDDMNK